ncbi:MAG: CoA-binding protein [Candidatus Eisenbacteria bacterium]|nr:CoA-binding protein [Candidatus Eisenbacteria bacterium]
MTTRAQIDRFLSLKRLGLAGASRSGKKFGNAILKELHGRGYDIRPLHLEADELQGLRCYRTPADLPDDTEGLILVVPPAQTERLVRQAAERGIRNIWIQQGAESHDAIEFCRQNGMAEVHGECILMFAEPVAWFHRVHRGLWRWLGKLPK